MPRKVRRAFSDIQEGHKRVHSARSKDASDSMAPQAQPAQHQHTCADHGTTRCARASIRTQAHTPCHLVSLTCCCRPVLATLLSPTCYRQRFNATPRNMSSPVDVSPQFAATTRCHLTTSQDATSAICRPASRAACGRLRRLWFRRLAERTQSRERARDATQAPAQRVEGGVLRQPAPDGRPPGAGRPRPLQATPPARQYLHACMYASADTGDSRRRGLHPS